MAQTRTAVRRAWPGASRAGAFALAVVAALTACASARAAYKDVSLVREFRVPDLHDLPEKPEAVVQSADGGFIAAGPGFAVKIDAAGKLLWEFFPMQGHPTFYGIARGADGGVVLCGSELFARSDYRSGVLVQLDAVGHPIGRQLLTPQHSAPRGVLYVNGCVNWADGILVYGHLFNVLRPGTQGAQPLTDARYWIALFDRAGHMRWEKQLPLSLGGAADIHSVVARDDGPLYFSTQVMERTELVGVSPEGEVYAERVLPGRYQFVCSGAADRQLEVLGSDTIATRRIELDASLKDNRTAELRQGSTYHARAIYRLPDRSLALFGALSQEGGSSYEAAIRWLAPTLELTRERRITQASMFDIGTIAAASPTAVPDEFVVARLLLQRTAEPGPRGLRRLGIAFSVYRFH